MLRVKDDVRPFINDTESLIIWSTDYFLKTSDSLQMQ